jgi:hypothetical protein
MSGLRPVELWRSRGGDGKATISNPLAIAARVHRIVIT